MDPGIQFQVWFFRKINLVLGSFENQTQFQSSSYQPNWAQFYYFFFQEHCKNLNTDFGSTPNRTMNAGTGILFKVWFFKKMKLQFWKQAQLAITPFLLTKVPKLEPMALTQQSRDSPNIGINRYSEIINFFFIIIHLHSDFFNFKNQECSQFYFNFSGGRPEGLKHNLKSQSATWPQASSQ